MRDDQENSTVTLTDAAIREGMQAAHMERSAAFHRAGHALKAFLLEPFSSIQNRTHGKPFVA